MYRVVHTYGWFGKLRDRVGSKVNQAVHERIVAPALKSAEESSSRMIAEAQSKIKDLLEQAGPKVANEMSAGVRTGMEASAPAMRKAIMFGALPMFGVSALGAGLGTAYMHRRIQRRRRALESLQGAKNGA